MHLPFIDRLIDRRILMMKSILVLNLLTFSLLSHAGVIVNKSTKEKISFNFDKDKKIAYINSSTRMLPSRILPDTLNSMGAEAAAGSDLQKDIEVLRKAISTSQEIRVDDEQFSRILEMINSKKYSSMMNKTLQYF
jgi:uncharacterized membrane protein YcgQ (UPF0703/DUF1980 family)